MLQTQKTPVSDDELNLPQISIENFYQGQLVWESILINPGTFAQKTRLKIFMICLVENNLFVGIRT